MHSAIKLGDKVELVTEVTLNNQQYTYYSKIQEVMEGAVVIQAPIEGGRIEPLELNKKYGMSIYTDKGLYRCEVMVSKRVKYERLYLLTLDILSSLQKYQRRQYYRMDCMLNFQYKGDDAETWHKGLILDISGGGIRFTSKNQLKDKKVLFNHIRLNMLSGEEEELFLTGVIIQSVPTELDPGVFENRIEFDGIDGYEREMIIKFIFEEERRRQRHRKGE